MRRRFVMGFLVVVAFVVVLAVGCQSGQPGGAAGGKWLAWWEALSVEEKLSHIQPYMVEGAELSAERPAPDLLSEQEVMIRVAEYAVQQGCLDPAHPIYEEVPELATARVAEPIFLYYGDELQQGKVNGHYRIYVADNVGKVLIETNVFAFENLGDRKEPDFSRGIRTSEIPSKKMLSQDNVKQFFSERFPLSQISTPLAVILNMDNVAHPGTVISWYITVSESSGRRNVTDNATEYLVNSAIFEESDTFMLTNENRLKSALSRSTVSGGWGTRIARIDKPLYLHDKLAAAKSRAAAGEPEPTVGPTPPVKITPVEF